MAERIQKILSSYGVASRRVAERMILDGRVTVGGIPAKLGQSAEAGIDEIEVDGVLLTPKSEHVYIALNKPRGYVTTMSDEYGRKTVISLVQDVGHRVYPVGRLDMNSEGLLLMTNDGGFAYYVMHPSHNITKTYEVRVNGDTERAVLQLSRPIEVDSHLVSAASVRLKKHTETGGVLSISVKEGRNRQIRKMCAKCGLDVLSLKRVSIGNIVLGSLKAGHWRHLTHEEQRSLVEC